ncbi:hypothetical protein Salmi_Mp081 (mitochondrion) [Salvia miltiorrhiza]|uniref:Uncharacterized protein n=1 Tax=Salvia miltiorrhiza TaxID=226208 RepID=V9P584_SALMI|nr:hypothetical protein Salmi_Mp081 [Salvia miltiorrhiza]AGU16609.1 hypothetical protein Salmi_Mp081 [Salvia miltiorrhiza]
MRLISYLNERGLFHKLTSPGRHLSFHSLVEYFLLSDRSFSKGASLPALLVRYRFPSLSISSLTALMDQSVNCRKLANCCWYRYNHESLVFCVYSWPYLNRSSCF